MVSLVLSLTTKTKLLRITMLINDKSQLKRNVKQIDFSLRLKLARVSADLTDSGRLLHTVGPATEKVRSPNLARVTEKML